MFVTKSLGIFMAKEFLGKFQGPSLHQGSKESCKTLEQKLISRIGTLTAPFNNIPVRTLHFKAQLTNAFSATINQMFGGSFQILTTAKRALIKSLYTVQTTKQCLAVVVSWEDPPNI